METEYHGGPVAGGTFPAEIWHDLMTAWIGIRDQRILDSGGSTEDDSTSTTPSLPSGPATTTPAPEGEGTAPDGGDRGDSDTGDTQSHAPEEPAPPGGPTPTPPTRRPNTRAHARSGRRRDRERGGCGGARRASQAARMPRIAGGPAATQWRLASSA